MPHPGFNRKKEKWTPARGPGTRILDLMPWDAVALEGEGGQPLGRFNTLVVKQGFELAGLEHLFHDVAATDELALHVELRDGGPV